MGKDFELFQREFKKWQEKFGLIGYRVYFKHEVLEGEFANITVTQGDMVATVRLNSKLLAKDEPFKDIKSSAKHEAIHLLLIRLETLALSRHATSGEIYEASEELTRKFECLIN